MNRVKLELKKPIKLGEQGEPITSLSFRTEIVAGDCRGIPIRMPFHVDDILTIGGRLCGQPDAVMNRLSFADLTEVIELVQGFMAGGRETPTKESPSSQPPSTSPSQT